LTGLFAKPASFINDLTNMLVSWQRVFSIISLTFVFFQGTAQVKYQHDTLWNDLLTTAKIFKKPVFIDFYTTWCKPCKELDKNVLNSPEVADKLNRSFLNYKLNAEKGLGIDLSSNFQVEAYPTLVFLDNKGNKIHSIEGLVSVQTFLSEIDIALSLLEDSKTIQEYTEEYQRGYREVDFLKKFMRKRQIVKQDNGAILEELLAHIPFEDMVQEEYMSLILEHASLLKGRAFEIVMSRRNEERFYQKLLRMRAYNFSQSVTTKNEALLQNVLSLVRRTARSEGEMQEILAEYQFNFYLATRQSDKFKDVAKNYLNSYILTKIPNEILPVDFTDRSKSNRMSFFSRQLSLGAQFFAEHWNDPSSLQQASGWAKRSVEIEEKSSNSSTYALLLHRMGQASEARLWQEKAIQLAKNSKEESAYIAILQEELAKMNK
jgi:thioredoxin-related protein